MHIAATRRRRMWRGGTTFGWWSVWSLRRRLWIETTKVAVNSTSGVPLADGVVTMPSPSSPAPAAPTIIAAKTAIAIPLPVSPVGLFQPFDALFGCHGLPPYWGKDVLRPLHVIEQCIKKSRKQSRLFCSALILRRRHGSVLTISSSPLVS